MMIDAKYLVPGRLHSTIWEDVNLCILPLFTILVRQVRSLQQATF